MIRKIAAVGLSTALLAAPMFANEGAVPKDVPRLDHIFVIVMENHGYSQIIGNPDTPFANSYANSANTATSYFAVDHTSLTWKTYQESLPLTGAYGVNFADGFFTDGSNIPGAIKGEKQTLIKLYAAKHNPFVYFQSVQEGRNSELSLKQVVGFEGSHGLFEDLSSGHVPNFSFIAPNQCKDQHGRGNAGPQCDYDPDNNGTQVGLNPALMD